MTLTEAISKGALRVLRNQGFEAVCELTLANGRRADIAALSPAGEVMIVEVKSSIADFKSDRKWPDYLPFCDAFYFAVSHDFPQALIPQQTGLIIADGFGGVILRRPQSVKLAAARRKALTLRFARHAAARLARAGELAR